MISDYRKVRIILIFDLPSVEKADISTAQKFVKSLKKLGFNMLQYSTYVKSITNTPEYERIVQRVYQIIPKKGNIVILKLTDKQYNDMVFLNGEKNKYDCLVGSNNVVFFGGDKNA